MDKVQFFKLQKQLVNQVYAGMYGFKTIGSKNTAMLEITCEHEHQHVQPHNTAIMAYHGLLFHLRKELGPQDANKDILNHLETVQYDLIFIWEIGRTSKLTTSLSRLSGFFLECKLSGGPYLST